MIDLDASASETDPSESEEEVEESDHFDAAAAPLPRMESRTSALGWNDLDVAASPRSSLRAQGRAGRGDGSPTRASISLSSGDAEDVSGRLSAWAREASGSGGVLDEINEAAEGEDGLGAGSPGVGAAATESEGTSPRGGGRRRKHKEAQQAKRSSSSGSPKSEKSKGVSFLSSTVGGLATMSAAQAALAASRIDARVAEGDPILPPGLNIGTPGPVAKESVRTVLRWQERSRRFRSVQIPSQWPAPANEAGAFIKLRLLRLEQKHDGAWRALNDVVHGVRVELVLGADALHQIRADVPRPWLLQTHSANLKVPRGQRRGVSLPHHTREAKLPPLVTIPTATTLRVAVLRGVLSERPVACAVVQVPLLRVQRNKSTGAYECVPLLTGNLILHSHSARLARSGGGGKTMSRGKQGGGSMSFNSLGGNVVDKHRSTGAGSSFSADLDDIALSGPTAMGELCCPCDGSSGDAAVAARAAVDDEGNGAWRIALDFQLCGAAERAPVPSPEQADAVALANFRAQMSGAGSKRRRRVSSSAGQTVEKAGWVALCVKNKEKDKARFETPVWMIVRDASVEWWPAPPGPSTRPKDLLHHFPTNRVRAERDTAGHRGITKISKSTKRITFHRARFIIRDAYQPEKQIFFFRALRPHETQHGVQKKKDGKKSSGGDASDSESEDELGGARVDGRESRGASRGGGSFDGVLGGGGAEFSDRAVKETMNSLGRALNEVDVERCKWIDAINTVSTAGVHSRQAEAASKMRLNETLAAKLGKSTIKAGQARGAARARMNSKDLRKELSARGRAGSGEKGAPAPNGGRRRKMSTKSKIAKMLGIDRGPMSSNSPRGLLLGVGNMDPLLELTEQEQRVVYENPDLSEPHALVQYVRSVPWCDPDAAEAARNIIRSWAPPRSAPEAMALLGPKIFDPFVRHYAVQKVDELLPMPADVALYLPQLVQCLRGELLGASGALAEMLITRGLRAPLQVGLPLLWHIKTEQEEDVHNKVFWNRVSTRLLRFVSHTPLLALYERQQRLWSCDGIFSQVQRVVMGTSIEAWRSCPPLDFSLVAPGFAQRQQGLKSASSAIERILVKQATVGHLSAVVAIDTTAGGGNALIQGWLSILDLSSKQTWVRRWCTLLDETMMVWQRQEDAALFEEEGGVEAAHSSGNAHKVLKGSGWFYEETDDVVIKGKRGKGDAILGRTAGGRRRLASMGDASPSTGSGGRSTARGGGKGRASSSADGLDLDADVLTVSLCEESIIATSAKRENSWSIVTPRGILFVSADSGFERQAWNDQLSAAIARCVRTPSVAARARRRAAHKISSSSNPLARSKVVVLGGVSAPEELNPFDGPDQAGSGGAVIFVELQQATLLALEQAKQDGRDELMEESEDTPGRLSVSSQARSAIMRCECWLERTKEDGSVETISKHVSFDAAGCV